MKSINKLCQEAIVVAQLLDTLPERHPEEAMFHAAELYENIIITRANQVIATRELEELLT